MSGKGRDIHLSQDEFMSTFLMVISKLFANSESAEFLKYNLTIICLTAMTKSYLVSHLIKSLRRNHKDCHCLFGNSPTNFFTGNTQYVAICITDWLLYNQDYYDHRRKEMLEEVHSSLILLPPTTNYQQPASPYKTQQQKFLN